MLRKSVVVLLVGMSLYAVAWATKGTGIPGVDVVLKKKPGGDAAGNTRTTATGGFTFTGVAPGTYSIAIEEEGLKDKKKPATSSNARSLAPPSINATLTRSASGGTDITFAGQEYEMSVAGQGVTIDGGTIKETSSGSRMEVNMQVRGGTTTISGTLSKAAKSNTGNETDKQNN